MNLKFCQKCKSEETSFVNSADGILFMMQCKSCRYTAPIFPKRIGLSGGL